MARGFLSGIVWGGFIGVGVSGAASVIAPPPLPPVPPVVSDAAPAVGDAPQLLAETNAPAQPGAPDSVPAIGDGLRQVAAPQADNLVLQDSATRSASLPELGPIGVLDLPSDVQAESDIAIAAVAPVLTNPLGAAPVAPQGADEVLISTRPAQPPAPVEIAEAPEVVSEAPEAPVDESVVSQGGEDAIALPTEVTDNQPDPVEDAPPQQVEQVKVTENAPLAEPEVPVADAITLEARPLPTTVADAPAQPAAPPAVDTVAQAPEAPQDAPKIERVSLAVPSLQDVQPAVPPETVLTQAPAAPPAEDPPAEDAPAAEQETASDASRPSIGRPAVSLTDRSQVTIRRPSSAPLGQIDDGEAEEVAVDPGAGRADDPRPVVKNAQLFENPDGKPLMSIVLIDDGSTDVAGPQGIAALRDFPYPLTFAVDSSLRDASERMARYRAEGFEVLAMVDLPEGALPSDAETTLGVILPAMTEVVGVLEGTDAGLQGSREVSDQVTAILAQSGHGLLTQDKGLNTMPQLARRQGVPADPIFRDFDSKGQTARVIRRFLDQAAFRAGQEGAVVMLGRMREETISALLVWGLQDRASNVALAPVTAVLLREDG